MDEQEIISYMDASDPDYENIQKAQAEIGKMIAKANEKKRIVDNFQVLIEIQSRIILPAGSNLIKKGILSDYTFDVCGGVCDRVRRVSRVTCALTSRERTHRTSVRPGGPIPRVGQPGEVCQATPLPLLRPSHSHPTRQKGTTFQFYNINKVKIKNNEFLN
jgi:hypothetical protein